jgi:flagellar assembly protein FliH
MLDQKSVLSKEIAEKAVMNFVPPKIETKTPQAAIQYLENKRMGSDFTMSDPIRLQTGVGEIEQASIELRIENLVLDRLKEIQESAHQHAFGLGLEEGRKQAYQAHSEEIKQSLVKFENLIRKISDMKTEILKFNESSMIDLIFQVGKSLALKELQFDREAILSLVRRAVEDNISEERITIHLSKEQFDFLEALRKEEKLEFGFLNKVGLEINSKIQTGGCLIETNYGEIDATIEQRLGKLWSEFSELKPTSKDKISA